MSSPTHVLSVDVIIGDTVTFDYWVRIPTPITHISTDLFTKAEQALLDDVDTVDIGTAYDALGIGKSTHGKPRGKTTRKKA